MKVKSESEVGQSCPTPSDPMDCSLPGFSNHGIFQARVLEWGAIAFSRAGCIYLAKSGEADLWFLRLLLLYPLVYLVFLSRLIFSFCPFPLTLFSSLYFFSFNLSILVLC